VLKDYSGLFSSGDNKDEVDARESEAERKQRLADEKKATKWAWFSFAYQLAKGDIKQFEAVLNLNFIFVLNFKSFELENKNIFEHYDFNKYNIRK
jgi:hypothetical protein